MWGVAGPAAAESTGLALLFVPLIVVAAGAVVVSLRLVRRYGRDARLAALGSTAALLLVCGIGGLHGPEPLPLPGLICLLWLPAPLAALAFTVLHGLRERTPMSAAWRAGATIAAVGAGLLLTGIAAQIVHGTSAYAVHYGTVATTGLPDRCVDTYRIGDDSDTGRPTCPDTTWEDRAGNVTTGTVHTDHRFWQRYGRYYSMVRLSVDAGRAPDPSIKITVYAVGTSAYMPGGTTTSARDAIGTPPLGWLAWAGLAVPAAFVTVLDKRVRRRPSVIAAAGRSVRGLARPALIGLWSAALLLLGLGAAGVTSPDPLPLPGLLCLLAAAAPLAALVFLRLHGHRGLRPMTARRRLLCLLAALAAGVTAIGAGAAGVARSGVYAQRYGAATTMPLPQRCRPEAEPESGKTADITECTTVTWAGPGGQRTRGTLHVDRRFWDVYGAYYDEDVIVSYVEPRPLLKGRAAQVRFPVRVSGPDAYLPAERSVAALGRPPLPWLSAAGVLLAAALLTGYLGRVRRRRPA